MIAAKAFAGKTVAVFGLARTGLGAVRALMAGGAQVIAWDDNSAARDAGGQEGAEIMPWREWPWEKIAAADPVSPACRSPIPGRMKWSTHAKHASVPVIGDVELFAREIRPDARPAGQGAGDRHHRHQRQIHHHRLDRHIS